jgi:hypothetical protein
MSTIYLDPVAMGAVAAAIGEHAREVDTAIADLEGACAAEVPPSLAGWLADELHDIAVHARLAEALYVVAALDTALRAQQIQADQSLATAVPALDAPSLGAVVASPDPGPLVLGSNAPVVVGARPWDTAVTFVDPGPLVIPSSAPVSVGARVNDHLVGQTAFAVQWNVDFGDPSSSLLPPGLTEVRSGTFQDPYGRQGSLGMARPNPVHGRLEFS